MKALRCIDKKAFRALSDTDVQQITLAMESMGMTNVIFSKAWKVGEKYLQAPDMMSKTCRLADAVRVHIIAPESSVATYRRSIN